MSQLDHPNEVSRSEKLRNDTCFAAAVVSVAANDTTLSSDPISDFLSRIVAYGSYIGASRVNFIPHEEGDSLHYLGKDNSYLDIVELPVGTIVYTIQRLHAWDRMITVCPGSNFTMRQPTEDGHGAVMACVSFDQEPGQEALPSLHLLTAPNRSLFLPQIND